jgi:hypothetical protein
VKQAVDEVVLDNKLPSINPAAIQISILVVIVITGSTQEKPGKTGVEPRFWDIRMGTFLIRPYREYRD